MLFNYGRDHTHDQKVIVVGNSRHSSGYVCLYGDVQNCKCDCYSSLFATSVINHFYANSLKHNKFKPHTYWVHERLQGYHELYLFTSFNARELKAKMRVS